MRIFPAALIGASALAIAGCTSTGQTERNAAVGAGVGAAAGAVIGNNVGDGDAQRGAIIGGVLGGAAGAAKGCRDADDCDLPGINDQADERDSDRDGYVDSRDRFPNDPARF